MDPDENYTDRLARHAREVEELRERRPEDRRGLLAALKTYLRCCRELEIDEFEKSEIAQAGEATGELISLCEELGGEPGTDLAELVVTMSKAIDFFFAGPDHAIWLEPVRRVLALLEKWIREDPAGNLKACARRIEHHIWQLSEEHLDEALLHSQRLLFRYEPLLHADPPQDRTSIAIAHQRHASMLVRAGLAEAAVLHSERAVALAEAAPPENDAQETRLATVRKTHPDILRRAKAGKHTAEENGPAVETSEEREAAEALRARVLELLLAHRDEEALAVSQEEITAWRRLRDEHGGLHEPWANALDNRAVALSRLGRYAEALDYSEQAVTLYELLSEVDGSHRSSLAAALFNKQVSLGKSHDHRAAATCTRRMTAIYDRLEQQNPGAYAAERAEAYAEHAGHLSEVGEHAAALSCIEQALELIARSLGKRTSEYADALTSRLVIAENAGSPARELSAFSEPAVALEEELAEDRPDRLPKRAQALRNHSIMLDENGRLREALEYSGRAVALCAEPEDLAPCLDQHAVRLRAVGRHAEALEHSARAVAAYAELVAKDRDKYLLEAGTAMDNHAGHFESLERFEEAAEHSVAAMAMLEEAGAESANPDALGVALGNHANRLVKAGRAAEALDVSIRTLQVREKAAEGAPHKRRGLAMALVQRAWVLEKNGEQAVALPYLQRGVAILEELAAGDRAEHLPLLAQAHHNQAALLSGLERFEEAAAASRRAVELRVELAATDENRFLPVLAVSLEWADLYHHWAGEAERSEEYARRFVELADRLGITGDRPEDLADTLHRLARRLSDTERESEAVEFAERARRIREDLVAGGDADERTRLVATLRLHVKLLMAAGRRSAAARSLHRAVEVARALSDEDRPMHSGLLRNVLSDAGWVLYDVDPAAALTATTEHLALSEELDDPDGNHYDLAFALDVQAAALARLDRHEEALTYSARALQLWEAIGNEAELAWCLVYRAISLAADGRPDEALAASTRALELYRAAYAEDPEQREYLGIALREHALILDAAGRSVEARTLVAEALEHFEALAAKSRPAHLPELAKTLLAAAAVGAGDAGELLTRAVAAYGELDAADPGVFTAWVSEAHALAESVSKGES